MRVPASVKSADPQYRQPVADQPATGGLHTLQQHVDASPRQTLQRAAISQLVAGDTAPPDTPGDLPGPLRAGIEALSGVDMGDIRVHRNSPRPAQLQAHAYAQGHDIHLAPGQERHLPHEAWHVVQQARGRVRPTRQMKGGTPVNDDTGLEREADAMGARALAHSSGLGARYPLSPLAMAMSPLQAQWATSTGVMQFDGVALDVLKSGSQFTWDYMAALIKGSGLQSSIVNALEEACLYLTRQVVEITGIEKYLAVINPYLVVLHYIKSVIDLIPQSIRTMLLFGIGWAINKFSIGCMYGAIGESRIATIVNTGSDAAAKLGTVIDFLYSLGNNPTQTIYRGIWALAKYSGATVTSSFGGLLFGEESAPTPDTSGTKKEPGPTAMVDANLGWFWLHAEQPTITDWDEESGKKRGGLVLQASVGAKVFGNVMGANNMTLRIPFATDWTANLPDVSLLSGNIGLDGIIRGGPIKLLDVSITNQGLQSATLLISDVRIGDGIVTATKLTATYSRSKAQLDFGADAELRMLGHGFKSTLALGIGMNGEFLSGSLDVWSPDNFAVIDGKLVIAKPHIGGRFEKGQPPVIGLDGDIELKLLDALQFAGKKVRIAYEGEQGFVGSVDELRLDVPVGTRSKVSFMLLEGRIDRSGFTAGKVKFIYAYGDDPVRDESDDNPKAPPEGRVEAGRIGSLIPGFDMNWISIGGIDALVVDVGASDIRLDSDGLKVGDVHKRIAKFRANLLGLTAAFDGDVGTGTLSGDFTYRPPIPSIELHYPIVPGVNGGFGLSAGFEIGANFNATLARIAASRDQPHITPWQLGATAGVSARGSVEINAGLSLGIPMVASVHGELFARAVAALAAKAGVRGTLLVDESDNSAKPSAAEEHRPRVSYDLSAMLSAELGAQVRGKALFVFEAKLWQYKFTEWTLGNYRLAGDIVSDEAGKLRVVPTHQGFADDKPNPPTIERKPVTVFETVDGLSREDKKIIDKNVLWRLVHDILDPGIGVGKPTRKACFEQIGKLNATGEDIQALQHEIQEHLRERLDEHSDMSLLMTRAEWVKYSTTPGTVYGNSMRKSVLPIDELLGQYHQAKPNVRPSLIDQLIEACGTYLQHDSKSRVNMVAKLLEDARAEKERLATSRNL